MKRAYKYMILLSSAILVACGDNNLHTQLQEEINISLGVEIENNTITKGGTTNLSTNLYDLRYTIEIYEGETKIKRIQNTTAEFESLALNIRLLPGKYKLVIWADFVDENSTNDLLYNTSSLRDIKAISTSLFDSDDSKDAYIYTKDIIVINNINIDANLKRPLSKITLINNGLTTALDESSQINISCNNTFNIGFDAFNGNISEPINFTTRSVTAKDDYNTQTTEQTIAWDYFFCNKAGQNNISFIITSTNQQYKGTTINDINIKPNYNTIIKGKIASIQ